MSSTPSHIFRDDAFLKMYSLTIGNVLHPYFKNSFFYDNICENETFLRKKQNSPELTFKYLETLEGITFRLTYAQERGKEPITGDALYLPENQNVDLNNGLAIIEKIERINGEDNLLAKYYVLEATIYQSPDIYSLTSSFMRASLFHIREAVRDVSHMFDWSCESGFVKKAAADETETPYVFQQGEMKTMDQQLTSEFELQNKLLDMLLSELGIS